MWWLKILSIGKKIGPTIGKGLGYATAIIAILGFVYKIGGDNREAGIRAEMTAQAQADVDALAKRHEEYIAGLMKSHARALESVKNEREIITKTETVIEYVDRIKIDPACHDLAIDVIGMLQQSTRIGVSADTRD